MALSDLSSSPILVPVDFSPHSRAALEFAACLSAELNAPIVILHVVHDPGEAPGFYAGRQKEDRPIKLEDKATQMMEEFLSSVVKDNPGFDRSRTRSVLKVGLPVTRILEISELEKASMIVMGSRGRTGISHILLGSKAEQVVRLSPIPVTIVKHPVTECRAEDN